MSKKCMVMKNGRVYVRHPKGMSDQNWIRNCQRFIKNLALDESGFQVEIYEGEGSSMISTPDMGFEVAYYWQYIELDNLGEIHMGSPDD